LEENQTSPDFFLPIMMSSSTDEPADSFACSARASMQSGDLDSWQEESLPGPRQLHERFHHNSFLFQKTAPPLPPLNSNLYTTSTAAKEIVAEAFQQVMPPRLAAATGCVRGSHMDPRIASRQQDKFMDRMESGAMSDRGRTIGPTYTSPRREISPWSLALTPREMASGVGNREVQGAVAIAENLGSLASNLLRINAKACSGFSSAPFWEEPEGQSQEAGEAVEAPRMNSTTLPGPTQLRERMPEIKRLYMVKGDLSRARSS